MKDFLQSIGVGSDRLLLLVTIIVCVGVIWLLLLFKRHGYKSLLQPQIIFPHTARKQRVWKLLAETGGVQSSIIDSNPRVFQVLQPAFYGAIHPISHDHRTQHLVEQQVISTPNDEWVAAYVLSDLVDSPHDGKQEFFKAEATAFVFARRLKGKVPEVAFVNRSYKRRSFLYMPAWKISQGELTYCEGAFMDKFDVYARPNEQVDALAFAAPDLLESIIDCADASDVYFLGNYVYFLMPTWKANERTVSAIVEASKRLVAEANTNLPRVTHPISSP